MSAGPRDVVVVGAGAAGLWAAARAAELGRDVLLLEKTPRAGTKVLASGGTRCNLTTTLGAGPAAALFGPRGARFLQPAFRALPPEAVRARFHALGVPTVEAPLEKVFPASNSARDVRDALLRWALGAGVELRVSAPVRALEPSPAGWRVLGAQGDALECRTLLLCPGGRSVPKAGTTGDGYAWLAALGLPVVEPVPALVPLSSPAAWVHELAGISVQDAAVRLCDAAGRTLGRRARPVVFTHRGISGPGAMDLSEPVARGVPGLALVLDLLPRVAREALRAGLLEAAGLPGAPGLASVLPRLVAEPPPRRLLAAAARQAGLEEENPRANALTRAGRHALIEALKGLAIPVAGTLGWDKAEVTAGGLDLRAVDPGTLRVRGFRDLFVFGELLDLAGPIGGLNFQAAFATAELAARALAR
jgi:predicted Rossmann fold flavoprotein